MSVNKILLFSILILTLLSCRDTEDIKPFSIEEINNLDNIDSLSCLEYLRLCSSVELLDSVFKHEVSSIKILKNEILNKFNSPVIAIDGRKEFKKWISIKELGILKSLISSRQECIPITNSFPSFPANFKSKIGQEAEFLIRLYHGEKIMNSRNRY